MTRIETIKKIETYVLENDYKGFDPYDALMSPIFTLYPFTESKILRWGFQQVLKRIPVNVRPLLGIQKGLNPVTLGLCIQAYSHLAAISNSDGKKYYDDLTSDCIKNLLLLVSKGMDGMCWGYEFDWEARYAKIPAYTPTVVATGIITNALFENWKETKNAQCREIILSAGTFVVRNLRRTTESDGSFCWSYSPYDNQKVLNATAKGARLMAQAFCVGGDEKLLDDARKSLTYVARHQNPNGSWPYAVGDARTWSDNHHTGYILDCFFEYEQITGEKEFSPVLEKGLDFYMNNFFENGFIPKYYNNATLPLDSSAAAQAIITLCKFGEIETANKAAEYAVSKLMRKDGAFYYQVHKTYTNRNIYMRWSVAWMYAALSFLEYTLRRQKN